ncbi:MarR family winged helix-turn-helix transcriptional regulator [Duganella callida]|uniref:MarR family transcriptional regulator n=1 Tax=Duganella callida TaxID=2561932 RepID=A0A4Y9S7S9_9BURK|nr:MarR family transcriptional regulator [Duganella callida]TFW17353.1 MarR family transcriptional regulator [Duganella callida]
MTLPKPPTLDQHLCFLIYSTSLKMTQTYKPLLAALKLTYPQYLAMVVLWERDGIGVKDLAQRLQQDSGSVTPVIKRLEAEGYLVRQRDPRDERNKILSLTPAGQALRAEAVKVAGNFAATCDIDNDEVSALMRNLSKLNHNLA